jgi:hypothetical protein
MLSKEFHEETIFSFSEEAPLPRERRNAPRQMTILRVGALIGPEGRELCLIRNISAGGLMAHVYSTHEEGEEVAVELKTNQQIAGKVIWADESNVGIRFLERIDVAEMLSSQSALGNGWRPRMPRVEIDRLATIRCGARVHAANTCDISQGGVKVEIDEPIEEGKDVVVTLERFRPLHGVVRWCGDGLAGIAFNHVVPFHELMGWLRPEACTSRPA